MVRNMLMSWIKDEGLLSTIGNDEQTNYEYNMKRPCATNVC